MKQTGERTRMREQATTDAAGAKPSLLGQGMLALPGIGELWLVWSELGLVMLSLPDRAPGEVEADMVDRGLAPPDMADVPARFAEPLLAYAAGEPIDPVCIPVDLRGTRARQVRGDLLQHFGTAGEHRDMGAEFGQRVGRRQADALARAADECVSSVEVDVHGSVL